MSFKTKEEIYNEGCDSLVDELLEGAKNHCVTFHNKAYPTHIDLEILLNDLNKVSQEIDYYHKLKQKLGC